MTKKDLKLFLEIGKINFFDHIKLCEVRKICIIRSCKSCDDK